MTFLIGLALKLGIPQRFAGAAVWGVIGLVAAIALGVTYWRITDGAYDRGVAAEKARWEAAQEAAEDQAEADSWALVGDINTIDTTTMQTVEKIREVPRDKPRTVAVEVTRDLPCLRFPDRLLNATNQYTSDLAAAAKHRLIAVPAADAAEGRGVGDGGR